MPDLAEITYDKPPEADKHLSLQVEKVSWDTYGDYFDKYLPSAIRIDVGTWQESTRDLPILNGDANPCLIMYVRNRADNHIFSGHFPITEVDVKQDILDFEKARLKSGEQAFADKVCNHLDVNNEYIAYKTLLERIKKLTKQNGASGIEIYLFGQNGFVLEEPEKDKIELLTKSMITQHNVLFDLQQAGVNLFQVGDYRSPASVKSNHTLCLPKEGKIIFSTPK